jgi:hypothetical protein
MLTWLASETCNFYEWVVHDDDVGFAHKRDLQPFNVT